MFVVQFTLQVTQHLVPDLAVLVGDTGLQAATHHPDSSRITDVLAGIVGQLVVILQIEVSYGSTLLSYTPPPLSVWMNQEAYTSDISGLLPQMLNVCKY